MSTPFEPPASAPGTTADGRLLLDLPGVSATVTVQPPGLLQGAAIFVDGAPAERHGWFKKAIPRDGLPPLAVRFHEGPTGRYLTDGDTWWPLGPVRPVWLGLLIYLPFGLAGLGGLLGGLFGGVGFLANRAIVETQLPIAAKAGAMVLTFAGSTLAYLVFAIGLVALLGT